MSASGKQYFTLVVSRRTRLLRRSELSFLLVAAISLVWAISSLNIFSPPTKLDSVLTIVFAVSFVLALTLIFFAIFSYADDNTDPRRRSWWTP